MLIYCKNEKYLEFYFECNFFLFLRWWKYTPDDYKEVDPLGEDCVVYFDEKWADVSCITLQKRICEIY